MKNNIFDLTGQVALVAGGSSGLGLQFAKAMANAGANVALVARRTDRLEKNAKEIAAEYGVEVYPHYLDLCDSKSVTKCVEDVIAHFGKIDILVNAGGTGGSGDPATMTDEQWAHVVDTNLTGLFYLCRDVARLSMIPNNYGRIVNVSSIHGFVSRKNVWTAPYCASKGGVHMMTKAMANDWGKYNITVNCIAPGYFPTELTEKFIDSDAFVSCTRTAARKERHGILGEDEVHVVRTDILDAVFGRQLQNHLIDAQLVFVDVRVLLRIARRVQLQFEVIVFAEDVLEPLDHALGLLDVVVHDGLRHFAAQARRAADQPLVVLFDQLLVDTRLVIESLGKRVGDHLAEVVIAFKVLGQQIRWSPAFSSLSFSKRFFTT